MYCEIYTQQTVAGITKSTLNVKVDESRVHGKILANKGRNGVAADFHDTKHR